MDVKLGNPAPLGLFGFATTTWMLSMVNAGWFSASAMGMVLVLAMAYGGTAQMIAGILEFRKGNTFGMVAFTSYGAFWWSFALFVHFFAVGVPASVVGWYLFLWGLISVFMWIASFRTNMTLQLIFLVLWITFMVLAIADWGVSGFGTIGGYLGLLTAALAYYLAAAEVINESFGRAVLPIGPFNKPAAASPSQSA